MRVRVACCMPAANYLLVIFSQAKGAQRLCDRVMQAGSGRAAKARTLRGAFSGAARSALDVLRAIDGARQGRGTCVCCRHVWRPYSP